MKKLFIFISMCLAVNSFVRAEVPAVEVPVNIYDEEEEIYRVVGKKAQFPGGNQPMFQFLRDNLVYPEQALKDSIQGKVFVEFVVNRDGSICNATVIRSSQNELLDAEAVRVVNIMPKWVPAEQLGKPVRSKFTLPVFFKLK